MLLETANKNKNFIPIGKNIIQPDTVYQLLRKNNQLFVFKTNITTSAIVDRITSYNVCYTKLLRKTGKVDYYDTKNGLASNWITDITEDREGDIWIAHWDLEFV